MKRKNTEIKIRKSRRFVYNNIVFIFLASCFVNIVIYTYPSFAVVTRYKSNILNTFWPRGRTHETTYANDEKKNDGFRSARYIVSINALDNGIVVTIIVFLKNSSHSACSNKQRNEPKAFKNKTLNFKISNKKPLKMCNTRHVCTICTTLNNL